MKRLFLAAALLVALLIPSSALAGPYNPTGDYAALDNCPLSRATLSGCFRAETTSGFITLGKKTTPIVNPTELQLGLEWPEEEGILSPNLKAFGAEDGNTLTKTPQPVPGGLLGVTAPSWWPKFLRDLFNETINNGLTGVSATMELAAPATSVKLNFGSLIAGVGTGLSLPVKIKLSNAFLGNNCYIGSNSQPIVINFTTGTTAPPPPNTPIKGSSGEFHLNETGELVTVTGNRLVNNSFAAPGANGCGGLFSFLVDPFVNSIVGLPSAAGNNTAVLEGTTEIAIAQAVRNSIP